ncbi:FecR family protein [Dyadobacter tibetensis]|uniref:FecR family protein n=1 Tax=Dyadobacter tibetensis TaxID=1211851 RepID=UPI00047108FC|nr:FecR family protein [Dyadobacter tibetensis]
MDRFANFTLRDFIQDEDFIQWVKYPTAERNAFWEAVRVAHPQQSPVIDRAILLVEGLATFYPDVPETEVDKGRQQVLSQLHASPVSPIPSRLIYMALAASIVLFLGIWWQGQDRTIPLQDQITRLYHGRNVILNEGTAPKTVTLPEGSKVILSANSRINYEINKKGQRQVSLEGEAIFDVTKNPNQPFLVYANGLITKVIGTRFKVSAYNDGAEVKVEVNSGRVKVYSSERSKGDPESDGIILTPNQSVIYRKKDMSLTRQLVERPQILITPDLPGNFTYTDTPISEVFEGLEKAYGIKVHYDPEVFKNCRLNMALTDESLYEKLELIGKIVEGRYNILDGQVYFIGAGCNEN